MTREADSGFRSFALSRKAMRLYKILPEAAWTAAAPVVPWSDDDRRDGFLHLSTEAQVLETAQRHFAGRTGLVALEIDAGAVAPDLRWEKSRGGALFPHLYGDLPRSAVIRTRPLAREGGRFRFADEGA